MVYVLLGTGFEETEALTPIDLLRRAGIEVLSVGVNGKTVFGGHNIGIEADITLDELDLTNLQMLVIPGGLGGVGGLTYVLSTANCVRNQLPGIGWSGLSIAMISRNNPLLVFPVALFFAYLTKGAECASLFADITPDVAQIIQGAILLLVTSERLIALMSGQGKKKKAKASKAKESEVAAK